MSTVPQCPTTPTTWPPSSMPISDDKVEVSFSTILADISDPLLKYPYSDTVQKISNTVLLLCTAILLLCLEIAKPDSIALSIITFKIGRIGLLIILLMLAVLYLNYNLIVRVKMEHELFEYKQAAATLKLGELLDAIHTEIDIRHRSGTLNENGALRQKNDFINELLPRIMVMPKYARRMALVFPTTLSVVTVLYGTWYIWGAIKLA